MLEQEIFLSFFVRALIVRPNKNTGKSFLLTTLYLWCVVNGVHCKAAAPTGIVGALVGLVHMLRVLLCVTSSGSVCLDVYPICNMCLCS